MIFTDVVFADGTFHTLRTVIHEAPLAVPRDTVQFDDHPAIRLVGLIGGRLAAGNGRLVAVGIRRDGMALVMNDEGRQRALGPSFGAWPVAIRYVEGLFEVFVVRDEVAWLKFTLDGDLDALSEPVILDIPTDILPGVGLLDLIEGTDAAFWGASEIELPYVQGRDDASGRILLGSWMTRGIWTVGLTRTGTPAAVNTATGRAYALVSGVTSSLPPRLAVDETGRPRFALSIAGADVAVFGFEDIEHQPIMIEPPAAASVGQGPGGLVGDVPVAGDGGTRPEPDPQAEQAQYRATSRESSPLTDVLTHMADRLQTIQGQINILTTALEISLKAIDGRLETLKDLQTAPARGFTGTVTIFGKAFDVTLIPTPPRS